MKWPNLNLFRRKQLTPEELKLMEIHFRDNRLNATYAGQATKAFVAAATSMFTEGNGVNYVSLKGFSKDLGFIEVIIQRTNARTVADVAAVRGQVIEQIREARDTLHPDDLWRVIDDILEKYDEGREEDRKALQGYRDRMASRVEGWQ